MYWINDFMGGPRNKKEGYLVIYELLSEARITGSFEFFGANIIIGPLITDGPEDGLYPMQIKLRMQNNAEYDVTRATKSGYFHAEGAVGELAALLSLFFRARFYIRSETTSELSLRSAQLRHTRKILRVNVPEWHNSSVFKVDKGNFLDFNDMLWRLLNLPPIYHLPFINACTRYNEALKEIGIDTEMAFVRLVSAVEAMSKDFKLSATDDPLASHSLDDILKTLEPDERQEIKSILITRKAMLKFIRFIEHYSKGYFKGGNFLAKNTKIFRPQLPDILKTIYTARSKYLHEGESMYLSRPMPGFKFDTDPSSGMYIGSRKFTENQKLPSLEFFDGLVRYCILGYMEEHLGPQVTKHPPHH